MAFSCGFFNSLNKDRVYNARDVSDIFSGIIGDGVFATIGEKMMVQPGTGMQITIGTGKAWFNSTWTKNTAKFPLNVDPSDLVLTRIDAIVLEVDLSDDVRNNKFTIVKGTPGSSPQKPQMIKTELKNQYPLAYITIKPNSTSITAQDIENRVGTSETPFVTAVLQTVTTDELLTQWEAEFNAWFETLEDTLSGDVAGNLLSKINDLYRITQDIQNDMTDLEDNMGDQVTYSLSGTTLTITPKNIV